MPRLKRTLPKYAKHKASGQAIVTLSGKDFYLGPHGTKASRLEYDRLISEWMANGRRLQNDTESTVVEVINAYRKFAEQYYRKNGAVTREYGCIKEALRIVRRLYGRTNANEFGPLKLKTVRQQMIDHGWCRTYINKSIGRVRRCFKWAVENELVRPDIYHGLMAVAGLRKGRSDARESNPVLPVDDSTVQLTLQLVPPVVADMIRIQRLTGCRPQDVCNLHPCDVDTTGDVWLYRPDTHKTEHHARERVIPIGPKGQNVLRPYLLRAKESHCFSPIDSEKKRREAQHAARKTSLSCGNRPGTNRKPKPIRAVGDKYTTDSYRRAIHRACDKAGIARWSPNRLRHSAGTEIRKRFGLEAAQVVLGHSKADVTQVYAERDLQKAVEIMKEVG